MNLGTEFYKKTTQEVSQLINNSVSFSAIGLSDFGRTIFLKHLTTLPLKAKFIFVDIYDLASYSRVDFFKLLLKQLGEAADTLTSELEVVSKCREKLEELVAKEEKIVLVINRLDLVTFKLDRDFFDNFRSLRMVNSNKIVFIFGLCKPIHSLATDEMLGTDVLLYSHLYYLPLYSKEDLKLMAKGYGPFVSTPKIIDQAAELSGGHFQLFQLLLKNNLQKNLLEDDFIKLSLKNLLKRLNHFQIKTIEKIALGKDIEIDDPYLLNTKMVQKVGPKLKLFSPLLTEYLSSNTTIKLPVKEKKLLSLLKKNVGTTVSRDEIFECVWESDPDNATDWALDALVYRLRKHPGFKNLGFVIENHKKQGYSLVKE